MDTQKTVCLAVVLHYTVLILPGASALEQPSRKDIAASHTRKVILDDDSPKAIMVKGFRSVDQVVVSAQCLARHMPTAHRRQRVGGPSAYTFLSKAANGLMQSIAILASDRTSSTPLHVTFIMDQAVDRFDLMEMFLREDALANLTFDFLNWPSHDGFWHLAAAYFAGGPVQFAARPFDPTSVELLALGLDHIFRRRDCVAPSSRIYLCDIPKFVLSPEELVAAADDVSHIAKLKIYKLCDFGHTDSDLTESQRWIDFDSKVKFVEAGFRPSPADVAAIMDGRRVASYGKTNKRRLTVAGDTSRRRTSGFKHEIEDKQPFAHCVECQSSGRLCSGEA